MDSKPWSFNTNTVTILAVSQCDTGHCDEVMKIYEDVLATSREVNGPEHRRSRCALNRITVAEERARGTKAIPGPDVSEK